MNNEIEKFKKFLKDKNISWSKGRDIVLTEAIGFKGHFTAKEMLLHCKEKKYKVSRATVYRCLNLLKESGVIRETAYGEKHLHYESSFNKKHHHHARCMKCNNVLEIFCREDNLGSEKELEQKKFQIIEHELHFYGICVECRE